MGTFKDFGLSFTMTIPYLKRYPKVAALIKGDIVFNVRSFVPGYAYMQILYSIPSQLFINNNKSLSKR
jgi:hypothetical protein